MNTSVIIDLIATLGIFILVIVGSTSAVFLLLLGVNVYLNRQEQKRRTLLKGYTFPASCYSEVQQRYPHLTSEQVALAFEQLRLYFEVCLVYSSPSSSSHIAMPSKLVDSCWHAFICETREYQWFCRSVFGGFLDHGSKPYTSFPLVDIPVDDIKNDENKASLTAAQEQQARDFKNQLVAAKIYHWALAIGGSQNNFEAIQIPLLFSIDQEFSIQDGYYYSPEMLQFLAEFDLKAAEAVVSKRETDAAGGTSASCGDGGSCGGCGGSL
jgi:hypothetical protein